MSHTVHIPVMQVKALTVGPFEANCYIAWIDSAEAVVIDPGCDAETIAETLRARRLTVAAILLTHGHVDHVSAAADIQRAFGAPVYIHEGDLPWAFSEHNQMLPWFTPPAAPSDVRPLPPDGAIEELSESFRPRVIHTPGHTPGCVCLHWQDSGVLFTGDTLFAGSVGRTDLPGGDSRTLQASLKKLAALDASTAVYPGHGLKTTIAHERQENFFLQHV